MSESIVNRIDRQFFTAPKNLKYLILGDSRASFGINPLYMPESFNFASPGENYLQTYYKLKNIINEQIKRVEYVIMSYDLHSIYSSLDIEVMDDSYWKNHLDYFEISKEINNKNFINLWLKANFFAYAGNVRSLFEYIINRNTKKQEILFGHVVKTSSMASSWIDKITPARKRVSWQFEDKNISDTLILYLSKLITLCTKNSIQVILIKFPVSQEYYLEMQKIIPVQLYDKIIDKLLLNYANINLLDYRKLYINYEEYFFDTDHLNFEGAIEFSKYLMNDLIENKLD